MELTLKNICVQGGRDLENYVNKLNKKGMYVSWNGSTPTAYYYVKNNPINGWGRDNIGIPKDRIVVTLEQFITIFEGQTIFLQSNYELWK